MGVNAAIVPPSERPSLRELYDTTLAPYLAAEDKPILRARRNRWIYSGIGLALAALVIRWAFRTQTQSEYVPMFGFALALGSIGYFFLATAVVADDVREQLMAKLAGWMGLRYEARGDGFDLDRFRLFALQSCKNVSRKDRLHGTAGGLAIDAVWAHLTDETVDDIVSERNRRTIERFTGLLVRLADPAPPGVTLRLVPPKAASQGMLRGTSEPIASHVGMLQMVESALAARPDKEANLAKTGDTAFDQRFELHAAAADLPAALARIDPGTRAALLDIASQFGGGPVAFGFDQGEILLAFVTKQRFEIGTLKPPMAQFGRVQHLADQMGILEVIAQTLATAAGRTEDPTAGRDA